MKTQITRRFFVKGAGLLSASAALAACSGNKDVEPTGPADATPVTNEDGTQPLLAIIHTNDTHGHDVEVASTDTTTGNFSMAAVPALRKEWEEKGYDVLVLDAGDATQGTPLVDSSYGASAIGFMNECGYDLMCLGNHEFDRGKDMLAAYQETAEFPFVSANVLMKDTGEPCSIPYKMFELTDGTKVGVFGLTTPATLTTARPTYTEPFSFIAGDDLVLCAQNQVDDLREQGADIVVCLGHIGNEAACLPNTSRELLSHVTGIDLFIDGHDHQVVEEEVEGTLLVETGCYLSNIGLVVIDAGLPTNQMVAYGQYDGIDQAAKAAIDDVYNEVDKELRVVIASTPFTLMGERKVVRTQETNLGDLYADAMLYDAQTLQGKDVVAAVVNSGSLRDSIQEGDISLKDVKTVSPFSDQYRTLRVTGAQLLEALEAACQGIGYENAIGAFPQVAGIEFTINATVPYEKGETYPDSIFASPAAPGSRVTIQRVGEADFDENETYTITTSEFVSRGGDTYHAFKEAAEKEEPIICSFDYEAFSAYLMGPLDHEVDERYREPQGRITIITD